jgi:riboflavin kinase/FMN adenylyltransferase
MEIVKELREIPNLALALGFFDGVHLGHQEVISCAGDFAKHVNCKSAVVTFKEHPYCYLQKESPKYILTIEDKYKYIEKLGVDYLIELDFADVCQMKPIEYLEEVLVKYFSPKAISTGFNHHFGVNKTGNVIFLSECQSRYNYIYLATPPQSIFGDIISSTAIRAFIKTGVVDLASSMLGRKFEVSGTVIKGHELGRILGYPTANIVYPLDIVEVPYGVYDVDVTFDDGSVHRGLANFGIKPTVSEEDVPSLETYIIDFDGNLYDKDIKVAFTRMIRPEVKFQNIEELKAQIDLDVQSLL